MSDIFHSFHVSSTFVCITLLDYRAVQIYVGTLRISEQFWCLLIPLSLELISSLLQRSTTHQSHHYG